MRRVVDDSWHTSQYLITINWVTVEKGYDTVRPKTSHDPQAKNITDDVHQSV